MIGIRIIAVGGLKERFYREAADEFLKRLSRYANVSVATVADERAPERLSIAEQDAVRRAEGERILAKLSPDEYVIALDLRGKKQSSEEFASFLSRCMNEGKSRVAFLIGGSLGLSPEALSRADFKLSFSDMTFSHQIFRVMLLEQVYRAFKIITGEPYHK